MLKQKDLEIATLGEPQYETPLRFSSPSHPHANYFVREEKRIRYDVDVDESAPQTDVLSFEEAGPRQKIFFQPAESTAAVVTCGGLSPGLNNVVRSIFYELSENYGVHRVLGIRNGYAGLNPANNLEPIEMSRQWIEPIDQLGGTALGSSRGPQEPSMMADFLEAKNINLLFCIGGDGTQRGAFAVHQELQKRGTPVALIGIPKTIDNDVPFVRRSFGFATALEKAAEVIRAAHVEARDAVNGIGLVKLMGRHAGFIAAGASVVSQEVNFALIPEIRFPLEGEDGLLAALEKRLRSRGHAVVVVAEGAGQHLFENQDQRRDASGNLQSQDIGLFLKERINNYFAAKGFPIALKYLDPSYFIRSVPASAYDRVLCDQMARNAVHAGMAGKTGMLIGFEHDRFIHVPIPTVVSQKKQLDVTGDMWRAVLQVTRQPRW